MPTKVLHTSNTVLNTIITIISSMFKCAMVIYLLLIFGESLVFGHLVLFFVTLV